MSDKTREALLALIEAVEHTPLGIRGIKAVEQGRAALAEPAAPVAKPVMPTEAELIAIAERLGSVGELCRTEDHPDTIWRIRCEVEELVREVLKTYAAAPVAQEPAAFAVMTGDKVRELRVSRGQAETYADAWNAGGMDEVARVVPLYTVPPAAAQPEAWEAAADPRERPSFVRQLRDSLDKEGRDFMRQLRTSLNNGGQNHE